MKRLALLTIVLAALVACGPRHMFSGNISGIESGQLMLVSDALISDYSSCAADFMLTGRPAFLYIADYDDYTGTSRNLYFDLEQSPYPLARNMEELETLIRTTDAAKAQATADAIGEFYGLHETGHACERVCEFIIDKLQ